MIKLTVKKVFKAGGAVKEDILIEGSPEFLSSIIDDLQFKKKELRNYSSSILLRDVSPERSASFVESWKRDLGAAVEYEVPKDDKDGIEMVRPSRMETLKFPKPVNHETAFRAASERGILMTGYELVS